MFKEFTFYEIEQLELLELYKSYCAVIGSERYSKSFILAALYPGPERDILLRSLNMTEKEELFAKFFSQAYNKGKAVDEMTFEDLDAWIRELENTTFEAKATLQGASQAKREREANLKSSEREKLRNADGSYPTSDAINAVTKRKDRMTKRDKLEETYRSLGMSEDDIKSLLGQIKVDEVKQTTPVVGALSGQVFNGRPKPIDTCPDCGEDYEAKTKHTCKKDSPPTLIDKIVENMLKPKEESKPFDVGDLFG